MARISKRSSTSRRLKKTQNGAANGGGAPRAAARVRPSGTTKALIQAAPGRHWDFANFRPFAEAAE